MIISCINCNKKFEIDSNLIPENGRLVQCNGCNHKWFFKKEIKKEPYVPFTNIKPAEEIKQFKEDLKNTELLDNKINNNYIKDNVSIDKNEVSKNNYNILGLIIVFIVSFIAIIIVLDTFKGPISKIVPNIEFLLYSLYETINDIKLFLKDLI
tara:strand:+ start:136 stop:594 length:459 start_codon:yes stop_codon:yes gene_type:complete